MSLETKPAAVRTTSLAVFATDGELLMRFRRHRDEAAFAEVVERHGRLVWLVCKQTLRHHQDVEDAFQATFLILAQRASTIRASDSAGAWLYRVAQRTAIAARRKRDRRREEPLAAEPPQGEEALPVIHDRQMIYVLMEELQALPERYQTPLVLRYFEGQSRRAIAEQTDSTLAQIQGRIVRGRRMLRSRLIRRGVSLSLAVGVVATASTAASAAVSPSLVAATAASSGSFITSGASGGASPAAVELAKQGVHAMWFASIAKSAAIAVGVLVAAGALWAAQQEGGVADIAAGRGATAGVDLQAVAVDVADAEEPAVVTIAAAEPAKNRAEANEAEEVVEEAPSQIRQLELERDHWLLKAKSYRMKAERWTALAFNNRGNEEEALLMEAESKLAEAKALEIDARLEAMEKQPAAAQTWPTKLLEAKALEIEVRREAKEEQKEGPMQLVLAAEAKGLELARQSTSAVDDQNEYERRKEERQALLEEEFNEIQQALAAKTDEQLELRTVLELLQIEKSEKQRERELLHQMLLQQKATVESLAVDASSDESNLTRVDAIQKQIERLTRQLTSVSDQLMKTSREVAESTAKYETDEVELRLLQQTLANLQQLLFQAKFGGETVTGDSIDVRRLKSMVTHLENELASRDAQLAARSLSSATMDRYGAEDSSADSVVKPGDLIRIDALNVSPNASINGDYQVEAMGTVALGATYGRVKVAGLTILQAEEAIKNHLAENFENPMVQVTMVQRAVQGSSFSFGNVPPTAAAGDLESGGELRAQIKALQAQNAALKKQVEGLSKQQSQNSTTIVDDSLINPGDTINVSVAGVNLPIGPYHIESMGTVALGPIVGRVKVVGMMVTEAEDAIKSVLAKKWKDVDVSVQVTKVPKERPAIPIQPVPAIK